MGTHWSLGANWRFRSPRDGGPNVNTTDLALSFRPSPALGLSLVGRDSQLNICTSEPSLCVARLSCDGCATLGDDRLMVELAGLVDQERDMGVRFAAQVLLPHVGRLGAAGELTELNARQVWTVTAGLDVRWEELSIAPAIHTSKSADKVGWSLLADVHSKPRRGLPGTKYVARVRMEGLGARALLHTVLALDSALHDPRIEGVVLAPSRHRSRARNGAGNTPDVAGARAAGKRTYCHLELASGSEYYLCAGAQRISMDPAGMLRLMGVSGESLYFGELLRDIGVRADFVRIGRYKSAPEQYTNAESSEPAREERKAILDDAYRRWCTTWPETSGATRTRSAR